MGKEHSSMLTAPSILATGEDYSVIQLDVILIDLFLIFSDCLLVIPICIVLCQVDLISFYIISILIILISG